MASDCAGHSPGWLVAEDRQLAESVAESGDAVELLVVVPPASQRLGAMEGEYPTRSGLGVEPAGETGFSAGGLVAKGQRVIHQKGG